MFMGGECRMAGVAVATPTLPVPHQHFALLSLLATPTLTCWLIILCFGPTNFGTHPPPMLMFHLLPTVDVPVSPRIDSQ